MYTGYLELGGKEIANTDRLHGYVHTADCVTPSFNQTPCGTLQEALGDAPYNIANISTAPWYDAAYADVSSRFFGVAAYDMDGVHDSSRSLSVTQAITEGGIIGDLRHATKVVKVRAILIAQGQDALDYGLNWLNSQLEPGSCGQHGTSCGFADLAFFTTCPPEMPYAWTAEPTQELARNLFTNPRFATTDGVVTVRENRVHNPLITTTTGYAGNRVDSLAATGGVLSGTVSAVGFLPRVGMARRATVVAGDVVDASVEVGPGAAVPHQIRLSFLDSGGSSIGSDVLGTPGTSGVITVRGTAPSGAVNFNAEVAVPSNSALGTLLTFTKPIMEVNGIGGPFFAPGVDSPDVDMTPEWTGTPDASPSILTGKKIAGVTATGCVVIQSSKYAAPGEFSARQIPIAANSVSYATLVIPPGMYSGGTVLATGHLDAPLTGLLAGNSRRIEVTAPSQVATPVPNQAGSFAQRLAYATGLTGTYRAVLWHGGTRGSGDVYWTKPGLFAGVYDGDWFSGASVAPGERPSRFYSWAGAPDASTSIMEAVEWTSAPDLEAFDALMRPRERYLHDVAITSGATVRDYLGSRQTTDTVKAADVEFTITSERGYVYERARPVPLLLTADAHEDVARNLFLNPAMDTPAAAQIIQRVNFAQNPSLETVVTGWVGRQRPLSTGVVQAPQSAGRVQNQPRAVGAWSHQVVSTGSTSDYDLISEYSVAIGATAEPKTVRIGIWGAVPSGGVSRIFGEYKVGTGTDGFTMFDQSSDVAADQAGRYYVSGPIDLPAGATTVQVRFCVTTIGTRTIYADAAMILMG